METKNKNIKTWSEIKNKVYGEKGTERRDQLEREVETLKIGLMLRQARESLNMTQEDLAKRIIELDRFKILLQGAMVAVPYCFENQKRDCLGCPLENICSLRKGERFYRVMRIIQAYALAEDLLPKEILISEIDNFLTELKLLKLEF